MNDRTPFPAKPGTGEPSQPATVPPIAAPAPARPTAPAAAAQSVPPAHTPPLAGGRRRQLLSALGGVLLLAALAYGAYWKFVLQHYESTDNAYVQAHVVQVTSQVGGTVREVLVDDTDSVRAGQPLLRLDPSDAKVALERAKSQLAQTVREVRTLYVNNAGLDAQIQVRRAEVERIRADLTRAEDDVKRRMPLVATGAVSGEEMKHAETAVAVQRSALAAAQSALAAAQQTALSNQALTEGTKVEDHPNVQRAVSALRDAWLALQRTQIDAPLAGQVARRSVQVGQRIAAGSPLMAVIPLDEVWVEANFKEQQLREMRIGQPVTLHADLYGTQVEYHGRISGLGAGTGAAFALLPAQNATGNWIKVVQRVPVRIELDRKELAEHPLRVGLSMEAKVDLADRSGEPVATAKAAATTRPSAATQDDSAGADPLVREIVQANLGLARK